MKRRVHSLCLPAECPSTISVWQLQAELGLLRAEPYYMIYWLAPWGVLSGGCLLDPTTVLAIIITAERLKAQTAVDCKWMALGDCSEHRLVSDQQEQSLFSPQRVGIAGT